MNEEVDLEGNDGSVPMINNEMYFDSIRSSGYNDTAMALGELIDNSLQAKATKVDVLIAESQNRVGRAGRRSWQAHEIAVLDNGVGMEPSLLQRALRLGDGEHKNDEYGMGKFGVGLPQASINQAKRIDVWSWQNGIESAKHAYIDGGDREWVKKLAILPPDDMEIPRKWLDNSRISSKTGTLVVWSNLDRITWTKAQTIYRNSEFLVGRMYRNWLTTDNPEGKQKALIKLVSFDNSGREERETWIYKPNDPMYMLSRSSGMKSTTKRNVRFEQWGEPIVLQYVVPLTKKNENGDEYIVEQEEEVTLKFSLASKELREPHNGTDAGNLDYGKHAKKNIGVSVMRAGRELELETKFVTSKDPRNRWWGAEVHFSPGLDTVLGVTNNKQHAKRLSDFANKDWDDFEEDGETDLQIKKRIKDEDLKQYICLELATKIRNNISKMMGTIEKTRTSSKSGPKKRHADSPERKGTEATKVRKEEGYEGESDPEEEELSKDERLDRLKQFLQRIEADNESEALGDIMDSGLKYTFASAYLESSDAFFTVDGIAGAIVITLNRAHVAYNELFDTLQLDTSEKTPQELNQMLLRANSSLLVMLIAWARFEDESTGGAKIRIKDIRNDWGRMSRDFLLFGKE
tara:strand:- start:133 stop:2028 length:1896 start_codon:yes stop_codon:yes gene_type:complete